MKVLKEKITTYIYEIETPSGIEEVVETVTKRPKDVKEHKIGFTHGRDRLVQKIKKRTS